MRATVLSEVFFLAKKRTTQFTSHLGIKSSQQIRFGGGGGGGGVKMSDIDDLRPLFEYISS